MATNQHEFPTPSREQIVKTNLILSEPFDTALNFADSAHLAAATGEPYEPPETYTIIVLEGPVNLVLLEVIFPRFRPSDGHIMTEVPVVRKGEGDRGYSLTYVRVRGNRREYWKDFVDFFGNGADAVWYMADKEILLDGEHVKALRVAKHFPDEHRTRWDNGEEITRLMMRWRLASGLTRDVQEAILESARNGLASEQQQAVINAAARHGNSPPSGT